MAGNKDLFENVSIRRAVLSLAVPTVISQLITVIYNMADTFFVGQTGDPNFVAAATVALPLFMIFTALANLFGIGGASLVSRCLGKGDNINAQKTATFSILSSVFLSIIYGVTVYFLRRPLLILLGADKSVYPLAFKYVFWTVCIGSLPSVLNPELAHLIRAEGYSRQASFGVAMGGLLNMVLDPIFIFTLNLGISGAAIATLISNLVATLYFVVFIFKRRKNTVILPKFSLYSLKGKIPIEVFSVGLPSFAISFLASISNSVLNSMIASYSNCAVAGMGIAKKTNLLSFAIAQGMTQGALPLIAYNYSSGNKKRMLSAIKTTFIFSMTVASAITATLFFAAPFICRMFIDDAQTVEYATRFLKIICLACIGTTVSLMSITVFQAIGKKTEPIILSVLRKGGLDVPFMFLFNFLFGINGIAFATPIADTAAAIVAVFMLLRVIKLIKGNNLTA